VIALTTPYLWYATRATGFVTLALFTIVVALGTLVATRVGGTKVGRFEVAELHRSASIVAMVFLALHVATTALDSFVPTGWLSVVVPGASHYRTLAVALGAVAFDLTLAVWVSSLLKSRIRPQSWRFIHWFSWVAFSSAVVHALLAGTDAHRGLGLAGVAACALAVAAAGVVRVVRRPARAGGRTALSPIAPAPRPRGPHTPKDPRAARPASTPHSPAPGTRAGAARPGAARANDPHGRPGPGSSLPRASRPPTRKGR
jgi:methionine sulfoxide reductase heme-binding subunit